MENKAAYLTALKSPLKVDVAPEPVAGPDEVIIKNKAIAINPVDWKNQDTAKYVKFYPYLLGEDVAGEVVKVGEKVTKFKVGDRVMAHCVALGTSDNKHAGFQQYTVAPELVTSPIPSTLTFAQAAVLPLSISTAAAGLYQSNFLALPYPSLTPPPNPTNKTLLVWGGASSVGSSAIQLGVASGLRVITTASRRNFEYVKSLGASDVVDYSEPDAVDAIVAKLQGCELVGVYDAIALEPSLRESAEVLKRVSGGGFIAASLIPSVQFPEGVKAGNVFAVSIATQYQDVAKAVWQDYVPTAVAKGKLQAKPDPLVVEGGIEKLQEGVDVQRKGVSAKKVVVTL